MSDVICDTSFLIHLSGTRIHNMDTLDSEIGDISFVIPDVVATELVRLGESNPDAARMVTKIGEYSSIKLGSDPNAQADAAIVRHISTHGGIVATMDKRLKREIRNAGGSTMSISANRIVLDSA